MLQKISQSNTRVLFAIVLAYYVTMAIIAPGFFTINNSLNLLYNLMPLLIVAVGQTFVILTSGIDLSVTSIIAVASVAGGYLMSSDSTLYTGSMAVFYGISVMVAVGGLIGCFNGWAVARLRMPAFMVTLTTMMLFSGLAIWLTKSQNIYNLPEIFVNMPYSRFLGIPVPVYFGLMIMIVAYILLNRTVFGAWIYALGHNSRAAKVSGVAVNKTTILVYVCSGICAAIASMLYTARLETGSPVMGQNILLDVIGATVIGGTSLFGGKGRVEWTLLGAVLMTLIDNSLNLLGLSFFLMMVVKGTVILGAAVLNAYREKQMNVS